MKNRDLCRGKRLDNGEWVEGNIIQSGDTEEGWEAIIIPTMNSNMFTKHEPNELLGFENWFRIDPFTICQCTGLVDKNDKIIYENDILMCHNNSQDIVKAVFGKFTVINAETLEAVDEVIGWHYEVIPTDALSKCEPFCFSMPLTEDYAKTCEFKVVGNVFDNPELLEVQDESVLWNVQMAQF